MSLRREFLAHKNKTMESFDLVSTDISTINVNLVNLRTMLASVEERISQFNSKSQETAETVERFRSDIGQQNSRNSRMEEKIEDLNLTVRSALDSVESNAESKVKNMTSALESKITSLNKDVKKAGSRISNSERILGKKIKNSENHVKKLSLESRSMSKNFTSKTSTLKELLPRAKSQSLITRKLNSAVRESQDDIRKVRNLINKKLRGLKNANLELEKKIGSQRARIAQLNRKIDLSAGKVSVRRFKAKRLLAKKTTPKKTIIKKITPKKTVTTIKTPRRKITKTVTKNKITTKKETPKTKEVYEVIKEKNPLI